MLSGYIHASGVDVVVVPELLQYVAATASQFMDCSQHTQLTQPTMPHAVTAINSSTSCYSNESKGPHH